jgi:hypothetical protein
MTLRTAAYVSVDTDGVLSFRESPTNEQLFWRREATRQYALNPAVELYVVNPFTQLATDPDIIGTIKDTRYKAGDDTTDVTNFDTPEETPDIELVETYWRGIKQRFNSIVEPTYPVSQETHRYPLYVDSDSNLRSMSREDFRDTYIYPTIDEMASQAVANNQQGTYKIGTGAESGFTQVGTRAVFQDLRYDTDGGYILTPGDQIGESGWGPDDLLPVIISRYFLYQKDAVSEISVSEDGTEFGVKIPCYAAADGSVQTYTLEEFQNMLSYELNLVIRTVNGYKITYEITDSTYTGDGLRRGTGMADTYLAGASEDGYQTRFVNQNDYRSQEFPNGVTQTRETYYLRIVKS